MGFSKNFGAPATRALEAAGYASTADPADVPDRELLALHGVGPKAVKLIREDIAARTRAAAPGGGRASADPTVDTAT